MISFANFFLEYRHHLADGTPTQSIQAKNGKDPNRIGPNKKNLHTVGPYNKLNKKLDVHGSRLTPKEMADMGLVYDHGKIVTNYKNSGSDIHMTSENGHPVGLVVKNNMVK